MKNTFYKVAEWLAFYSAIPGGIILALGIPGARYKTAILISYVVASVFSLIHAVRTKQWPMFGSSLVWLTLEMWGLLGPDVIDI